MARAWVKAGVALVVGMSVLTAVDVPARAATTMTWVRTIGGPGHAGLYGWGAATMSDGSVLVSDYWNLRVQRFSADGQLLGTVVPDDGNHEAPYDVAVDTRTDTIYVGDVDGSASVDKYSADGTYLGTLGTPGQFEYPAWVAVDAQGRVAVADSRKNKIAMFDDQGNLLYEFGFQGTAPNGLKTPRGIDFAPDGRLFVLESNGGRVNIFDVGAASASSVARFPVPVADSRGLLVHPTTGEVIVVNTGAGVVSRYSQTGTLLGTFGGIGTAPGRFVEGGRGITADGQGDLWIGDMPNFRVQQFTPTGGLIGTYPDPAQPPVKGGFTIPGALDLRSDGGIVVNDTFNWRIQTLTAAGAFVRQFGTRATFNYARGVAVDPRDDSIVVANSDGQNLKKFNANGQLLWTSAKGFRSFSVDIGPDGTIYAADGGAGTIRVLDPNGTQVRTIGNKEAITPRGIEVDPDGSLWLVGSDNGRIVHYAADGTVLASFGSKGQQATQLAESADVTVDATRVYVADKAKHRIKVWTKAGVFIGAFGTKGTGNGQFENPMGLATLGEGRILVLDAAGERIQEVVFST
jgi:tripartite motif-containing protein 71